MRATTMLKVAGLAMATGACGAGPVFPVYVGPSGGSWGDPGNWSPVGVPDQGFGGGNAFFVSIDGDPGRAVTVVMNHGGLFTPATNVEGVTVDAGDQLTIADENRLQINDSLVNDGVVHIASATNQTDLRMGAGTTISGTGTMTLSGDRAMLTGVPSLVPTVTHALGHTIEGHGEIGENLLVLINEGIIEANDPGMSLEVDPASGNVNSGMMRATGGGHLRFTNAADDWTNTFGVIEADDASVVSLSGARVTGGVVRTLGTGVVETGPSNSGQLVDVTNDGTVMVRSGTSLLIGGVMTNNGSIEMESASLTTVQIGTPSATFDGPGELVMTGFESRTTSVTFNDRLVNSATHTIRGGGRVGSNVHQVDNAGLIRADLPGSDLQIDPRGNPPANTNSGVMDAIGGGRLVLTTFGDLDNTGGEIVARAGGEVHLFDVDLFGGEVRSEGTGVVWTDTLTLDGVTFNGAFEVRPRAGVHTPIVMDSFCVNDGEITFKDDFMRIASNGDVGFTGSGTMIAPAAGAGVYGANFTNGPGHTAEGPWIFGATWGLQHVENQGEMIATGGTLQFDTSSCTNSGTIIVEDRFWISRVLAEPRELAQSGTIDVRPGGVFDLDASVRQSSGEIVLDGTLDAFWSSDVRLDGGSLRGSGVMTDGTITNEGAVIDPGNGSTGAIGALEVGDLAQGGGGTLRIEIDGSDPGVEHDVLVADAVTLGGTLEIEFGFSPSSGDSFTVLVADSIAGTFGVVTGTDISPLSFHAAVTGTTVTVYVTCPADWNGDTVSDVFDVLAFLEDFDSGVTSADLNGDMVLDIFDVIEFLDRLDDC